MAPLEGKDLLDALMKLAEFKRAVREGRRQFEWKFTATAFVALAGLSAFPEKAPFCAVFVTVILIWVIHTHWVYWNSSRAERDRDEMYNYKGHVEKLLPIEMRYHDPNNVSKMLPFFQRTAALFQIFTGYGIGCFSLAVRYFLPH